MRIDGVAVLVQGPDGLDPPEHEEVGVGEVAAQTVQLFAHGAGPDHPLEEVANHLGVHTHQERVALVALVEVDETTLQWVGEQER